MLSRVAENLYWMARYLERAEDTARLIRVTRHVMLDYPGTATLGWSTLIDIVGAEEDYAKYYDDRSVSSVLTFLCADRRYGGSILGALGAARESLRTTRDVMPREVWEEINRLFLECSEMLSGTIDLRRLDEFLRLAIRGSQTLAGMLDGSLSDTQAIAVSVVDVASGPITVTTTNDVYDGDVSSIEALIANRGADGKISLREAITAANNTVGTDTILFGIDGTFTISALLGSGDDNNTKGDFDVKDSLVIIGNGVDLVAGTANTVIAGLGSERVFDLRSGAATVTMSGLKIQGGGGEDGGALRINSAVTATLGNVIISGNNGKDGGAIYNDGRLTISRATISGNTAVGNDGGAIYNTGTLTLSQLELAGNVASGGHKGGAIYNKGDASLTEV